MDFTLITAAETQKWREVLARFPRVDVCQIPEYHSAYASQAAGTRALLWHRESGGWHFAYPFLLTPVVIGGKDTGYFDISAVYGYSGALSTHEDPDFLEQSWEIFDRWALEQRIIAEFNRYSIYAGTERFAHPQAKVEFNRPSNVSHLNGDDEALFAALGKKTRNMIRKAEKAGITARVLDPQEWLGPFRELYAVTMRRNDADEYFDYDDHYYEALFSLPSDELRLFGAFHEGNLVAAAMALRHGQSALYHLGASLHEFSALGAGNMVMYEMSRTLGREGVTFLTVGGGRTTAPDDPLYRFKKSNATDPAEYKIGKRIVDPEGYGNIVKRWENLYKSGVNKEHLIFWR